MNSDDEMMDDSDSEFWSDDDFDVVFEKPRQPSCENCPDFVYISNPSCTRGCSWGRREDNCIHCIFMGAWIMCPCALTLRLAFGRYGEDYERYKMQQRQWEKRSWLIVHPTANLQRERNVFRAAQLWKAVRVSDLLTLIGTFYSAGITFARPVEEAPRGPIIVLEEMAAVPDFVRDIYLGQIVGRG